MLIGNDWVDTDHKGQDREAIITAMNATLLGAEVELREDEEIVVGQIVIVAQRVILGKKWAQNSWKAPHKEGEEDGVIMGDVVRVVSYTIG